MWPSIIGVNVIYILDSFQLRMKKKSGMETHHLLNVSSCKQLPTKRALLRLRNHINRSNLTDPAPSSTFSTSYFLDTNTETMSLKWTVLNKTFAGSISPCSGSWRTKVREWIAVISFRTIELFSVLSLVEVQRQPVATATWPGQGGDVTSGDFSAASLRSMLDEWNQRIAEQASILLPRNTVGHEIRISFPEENKWPA